jgi:hypothetical protein
MKYSILLVSLLSVASLFGADQVQKMDSTVIQQTNSELAKARAEVTQANEEARKAKMDLAEANAEKDEAKAATDAIAAAAAEAEVLKENNSVYISVVGQGVAPMNTASPAQAYALAKRAAIADAYRAIAEKVKGVRIDGQDTIKNMMVQKSTIRTSVQAMVRNANIVETTFKEGLCEVEMEIVLSYSDFAQ